jgi:hypothetical protein
MPNPRVYAGQDKFHASLFSSSVLYTNEKPKYSKTKHQIMTTERVILKRTGKILIIMGLFLLVQELNKGASAHCPETL